MHLCMYMYMHVCACTVLILRGPITVMNAFKELSYACVIGTMEVLCS